MVQDIYDPLKEYIDVFRPRFRQVAESTFEQLAGEAHVDVEANRATCTELYRTESSLDSLEKKIKWWMVLRVALWIIVGTGALYILVQYAKADLVVLVCVGLVVVASLAALFSTVHPRLKEMKGESADLLKDIEDLLGKAWEQMQPLNRLYDLDVLTRMMTQTVPRLEFDPYFTKQRLADLRMTYGWDGSFNEERSVIYSHSGLINGNPFVICRTRKMEMGTKTYDGELVIHWTETERDSDGKYYTVEHSETLHASVTAPYPYYPETTRLIYGNTAAPDLIFYRQQSGLAGKERSFAFRSHRNELRKKARDLTNADFAMMTNEEFETCFDTSNRNHNQQFALLFTPLAQESMLSLLRDKEAGYGDDFDFHKDKMINCIEAAHMQELNLDMDPRQYEHFDFDEAQKAFVGINANYFRAIYFTLAPLLCVPMYQQIRPLSEIYGHGMAPHSSFWEHEAIANFWGEKHFMHPDCVTQCVLKTYEQSSTPDDSKITVYAYGHSAEDRVTYISKYGGDGNWHDVPVYWQEYIPVVGNGAISIHEDNGSEVDDPKVTQTQRLSHISSLLSANGLSLYRRHIASRLS